MDVYRYEYSDDIEIMNLGDVHRGHEGCDSRSFHKAIQYIEKNPNCYWVSTSDLLETAMREGKIDSIYHSMPVQEELDLVCTELEPIANKCLGFVASNHHDRVIGKTGLDLDSIISHRLNIPSLGQLGTIQVLCGKNSYYITMHHGVGAGRTTGAKANSAQRLQDVVPCADVYMSGHTHCYMHFIQVHNYIDRKRGKITKIPSHYCVTGHYLLYDDSYAPKKLLTEAPIGSTLITLKSSNYGANKEVTGRLFC